MNAPLAVLLPGLDGTGEMFDPFVAEAPAGISLERVALPNDVPLGYGALADWVLERLPTQDIALVAESFSGPLALLIADRCTRVRGVVLCATFVDAPVPRLFAHLPRMLWSRPPPVALVSLMLTGGDRAVAGAVRRAMSGVAPEVIAARIAALAKVDVTAELMRFTRPLLSLRSTRDRLVPASATLRIRRIAQAARCVDVDAPHLMLQTHPAAAWRSIAPFLSEL